MQGCQLSCIQCETHTIDNSHTFAAHILILMKCNWCLYEFLFLYIYLEHLMAVLASYLNTLHFYIQVFL